MLLSPAARAQGHSRQRDANKQISFFTDRPPDMAGIQFLSGCYRWPILDLSQRKVNIQICKKTCKKPKGFVLFYSVMLKKTGGLARTGWKFIAECRNAFILGSKVCVNDHEKWAAHRPPNIFSIANAEGRVNERRRLRVKICGLHEDVILRLCMIPS